MESKPEPYKRHQIPTVDSLLSDDAMVAREGMTDMQLILNQEPKSTWVKQHPVTKGLYLPIERVEWLLTQIYRTWWVEVKNTQIIANSVVVTVRLWVIDPVTLSNRFQDGVGASPLQTDQGAKATDLTALKSSAVQMAAPAAKIYALKDAAECFGKIFGKDLNRKDEIAYDFRSTKDTQLEELKELYVKVGSYIQDADKPHIHRIINDKESASYSKAIRSLKQLEEQWGL